MMGSLDFTRTAEGVCLPPSRDYAVGGLDAQHMQPNQTVHSGWIPWRRSRAPLTRNKGCTFRGRPAVLERAIGVLSDNGYPRMAIRFGVDNAGELLVPANCDPRA